MGVAWRHTVVTLRSGASAMGFGVNVKPLSVTSQNTKPEIRMGDGLLGADAASCGKWVPVVVSLIDRGRIF